MANTSPFSYSVISVENSQQISDFLVKYFFPHEPISRAFGLPTNQVTRWFPAQVHECLKQSASICATDSTGQVVGVAINILVEKALNSEDGKSEGRGLLEVLDLVTEPVMVEIAKFLGTLNQVSDDVYRNGAGGAKSVKTFNCIYLAILPSLGGRGIGKRLIEESEKVARGMKVPFCQVDTTSDFSYRIFHKHCGYTVIREIDLKPYIPGIDNVDGGVHCKGRILLKKL